MLKGTTTIELTDVKTGNVRKIVHENMVTNAVNDMCNTAGFFRSPISCSALNTAGSIAENMFGGLMIWEKPLDLSSADDYYLPTNNNCIGYGCQLSNGTINDKMGTLNESESGAMENGHRFVWDFTTNQGNGEISAVSLVPRIAGQLGFGLTPDKYASSLNVSSSNFFATTYTGGSCSYCRPYLFADGDVLYGVSPYNLGYNSSYSNEHISRNGKKLVLKRYHFPVTKLHLSDKVESFVKSYSDIEVKLPDSFNISATATRYYGFCNYDNGFIYLCIGTTNNGATLATQICKINVKDWSCSVIDIDATFGSSFTWCTEFTSSISWSNAVEIMKKAQVRNNKLWMTGSPTRFIDLSAPSVVQKTFYYDETEANISTFYASAGKHIYCVNDSDVVCMIDTDNGKVSITNAVRSNLIGITRSSDPSYSTTMLYHVPHIGKNITIGMYMYTYTDISGISCVALPHVMTTKNNLDVAVTKTSGQTMKVTYVLTEV